MPKFNSLQERFNHLRNNVGFPVTLWEEFIQDCLAENSNLKAENTKLVKSLQFDPPSAHDQKR